MDAVTRGSASERRYFGCGLRSRLLYALLAGLSWWVIAEFGDPAFGWIYSAGAVFGALVLMPYLEGVRRVDGLRAIGLCAVGFASYWTAQLVAVADVQHWIALPGPIGTCARGQPPYIAWLFDTLSGSLPRKPAWSGCWSLRLAIAGAWGAAVVGVGARTIVPLCLNGGGWLALIGAGTVGGLLIEMGERFRSILPGDGFVDAPTSWLPGHVAWEVLVCAALWQGASEYRRRLTNGNVH